MGYEGSSSDLLRALSNAIQQLALDQESEDQRQSGELLSEREIEQRSAALANLALREYKARRSRTSYVDAVLLREPAWDILIDLFIQHASGKSVNVTSAAIASGVPLTTALRSIGLLQKHGLIERHRSSADYRVKLLRLTGDGYRRIGTWLDRNAGMLAARA
jgi:DNA-binding MarR family transcriptional regulator